MQDFQELVAIMARLRSPNGCPWDLKQNHRSLIPYLLEEAYECIEAIEAEDDEAMCEELGDLLLQVVFHAQMAAEAGKFGIAEVCRAINEKMIRRHPHIFLEEGSLETADQVLTQWEEIKKREKGGQASVLAGVGGPALPQAALIQERVRRTGFRFPDQQSCWDKLQEELEEFRSAPSEDELGDVFFALVSLAGQYGMDPEAALRSTNRKFRQRFQSLEQQYPEGFGQLSSQELASAWREVRE
jgi:tetrapyrrole methylase family protein/MazG family protein